MTKVGILGRMRKFLGREDGGVSIEYVLWVCYMVGLACVSTDATLLMHERTVMFDAARDASRMVASGQKTEEEAQYYVSKSRFGSNQAYQISVTSDEDGFVTTTITVPFSEVLIFSNTLAGNGSLVGEITMWKEV